MGLGCDTITMELEGMFIFTPIPIQQDVLEKYLHGTMSNDRAKWHKYWEQNDHTKAEDMPTKVWPMLDKWWHSPQF